MGISFIKKLNISSYIYHFTKDNNQADEK